jgi:tetratricopeptide (TPR) repeat protein
VILLSVIVLILGGLTIRRNGVWENGITLWQDVIKKAPMQARGYVNLGKSYLERGDYELALRNLEIAELLDPVQNGEVLNNIGLTYFELKEYDLAIHYFLKSLSVNPGGIGTYNNLGLVYMAQNDNVKAKEFFQAELYNSDHLAAYNNLGLILMAEGLFDEAEKAFHTAQKLNPYQEQVYKNLAALYVQKNDVEREKDIYQQSLRKFPGNMVIVRSLVLLCLAQKDDVCVDEVLSETTHHQKDAKELTDIVSLVAMEGTAHTANKYYQRLLKRFPKYSALYSEYGKFFGNYNQFDQAIAIWEQGIKVAPEKADEFKALIAQAQQLQKKF